MAGASFAESVPPDEFPALGKAKEDMGVSAEEAATILRFGTVTQSGRNGFPLKKISQATIAGMM